MNPLFADTFYYLALTNPSDVAHEDATTMARTVTGAKVTTTWILTELGDALCAPAQRHVFTALIRTLKSDSTLTIVPPCQGLFDRGLDLYARRPDKGWSLTDCISFIVMEEQGISEALTGDHHFAQAGFKPLFA